MPRNTSVTPWRDEVEFHFPTIEKFAADFPKVQLENYNVASTPGYHLVMAAIYRSFQSHSLLLMINALISSGCLLALFWACSRGNRYGWMWGLIVLLSPNFHYSAMYLRSDNASWLFVFLIVGLAMRTTFSSRHMIIGAVLLLFLAIFRHVHIWSAAVLWTAAYFSDAGKTRNRRLIQMILLTIPAFAVVFYFIKLWHGLVPPHFQTAHGQPISAGHSGWQHEGPNLAVPVFILAVMGVMQIFYALALLPKIKIAARPLKNILILSVMILPLLLIPPTNWDDTQGRYSGLWNVAKHLPAPAQRSILIIPLAMIGFALFLILIRKLPGQLHWIAIATLLAFITAQTANAMAWQKYYEPFLIGWLSMIAATISANRSISEPPAGD